MTWKLEDLIDWCKTHSALVGTTYAPARPLNGLRKYLTLSARFRAAWEVFWCRADSFYWPEESNPQYQPKTQPIETVTGPLRYATGPDDCEGLGREFYWELTPEQREMRVASYRHPHVKQPHQNNDFCRGWLAEYDRHQKYRLLDSIQEKCRANLKNPR